MGGALLSTPWRDLPLDNDDTLEFVKSYKPRNSETKHLRILLHGPAGAGKSSFINSVNSVVQGRITGRALTDAISRSSFTLKYKTYKMANESFVFNDIMGFEESANHGVQVEDVKLALRGHVTEGYKFSHEHPLTEGDPGYNSCPTLEDKVHVLICVVPAGLVCRLSDGFVRKMRDIRLAASEMGIPQLVILTKPDEACPEVGENIRNIYRSKSLKEKVEEFHVLLGIPLNCIFLVKNYHSEMKVNDNISAPILYALRRILSYGEDFLNHQ